MLMECEPHCGLEACERHGGATERQVEQKRRGMSTAEGLLAKGFCSTWRTETLPSGEGVFEILCLLLSALD